MNSGPSGSTSYSASNFTSYCSQSTPTLQFPSRNQSVSRTASRPGTRNRHRSIGSTIGGGESQQIICAVSEARGVAPTVGLAFVNLSTGEAVLSQFCDNQFYSRTCLKLQVFNPTEILMVSSSGPPNAKSKMYALIEEEVEGSKIVSLDRRYWSETAGMDYIQQMAFHEEIEALKIAIGGNYFCICCLAAALKYVEHTLSIRFALHSLRIKYQPSEGSMMIDLSTIVSLELIQNIQNVKSKDCLFGLMNETLTPMGSRLLRINILQPSTQADVLTRRYDALEELTTKEEMFFSTKKALKAFLDVDKLLTKLIIIPTESDIVYAEQCINDILILKNFVHAIEPVHEALTGARSALLTEIQDICDPVKIQPTIRMIANVINADVSYQRTPLDLRNQRTYAVKAGLNGLLDVARQTYKEATEDVHRHVADINQEYEMHAETRYDPARRYYLRMPEKDFDGRSMPEILVNCWRKKGYIECQTMEIMKFNQRIEDSQQEVILMSDKAVQELLDGIREEIPILFRISDSIAMLDMLVSFATLVTFHDYVRPELTDCLAIKAGRHPVREKAHKEKFIPNDVYATQQSRFQIITGCNMSGKSTYIRSIALITVMAQIGSFVPAQYASFPLVHQLFARVSMDDSTAANVSTFAAEMRETAYILRNIDKKSLAIIDELGRGTSTQDGLAIALSIAEALVDSKAFVWFATHFRELAQIMAERTGVLNMHLSVDISDRNKLIMLYKIAGGYSQEERYGLALARVVDLPPLVLEVAEQVSTALEAQAMVKKQSSKASAISKRRKLVLSLRETLIQANESPMQGKVLLSWLRKVQEEFVRRMTVIEQEVNANLTLGSESASNDDMDSENPDGGLE